LEIRYDDEAFHFGETTLPAPANKGVIKLRLLLDKASLEMFANEGAAVATDYAVAAKDDHSFRLSADGEVFVNRITINSLSSIWP
jgi:sucrose-6-phosphate hydrolase SacC (GH32 family)